MVKGRTRQVILVKSPDPAMFEEAIFIVREEAAKAGGLTSEEVLRQARQAADGYLKGCRSGPGLPSWLRGPLWCAAGAVGATAAWFLAWFGQLL